jgi:amino acid adenylation domain-containing protein
VRIDFGLAPHTAPNRSKLAPFRLDAALNYTIIRDLVRSPQAVQSLRFPMSNARVSPVSFGQRRLMFLEKFDPGASAYNLTRAIRIDGPLDADALTQTFAKIVDRHASLRTRFIVEAQDGYQIVDDHVDFRPLTTDLSHLLEFERETEALRLAHEAGSKGFDLTIAPLFRTVLARLGPTHHLLIIVMHHAITDGWSMSILFNEICQIYSELVFRIPARTVDISVQYADFARLQRETLTEEYLSRHVTYWREKLRGYQGHTILPTDRPRPTVQSHEGAIETFSIRKDDALSLQTLAESSGATLFMVLLAAFQTLISRYTGSDDLLIGTPAAGRSEPRFEGLIGFFVNTLVMRGDLSGNPTFLELLRRTRETTLEAYEHQDLPFEKLVDALNPPRDLSFTPLFQIMFVLHNGPRGTLDLPGLVLQELEFDRGASMFDLTFEVWQQDGLRCSFEYCTALFDKPMIRRLARSFEALVSDIARSPDRQLSALGILDGAARDELILQAKSMQTNYRRDARIEELFEQQVGRTPDAVALLEGDKQITYRDLNGRANAVARALIAEGLSQDRPVGVYVERSIDAVVAFLAALKANTPYVPLDVSNPPVRVATLINDSGCEVVLTHRERRNDLPERLKTISLDEPTVGDGSSARLVSQGSSNDLAYIIYTSGSTGIPKGVEGRHRSAVNRFQWMWRTYPFAADETCCAKSALGFVDSIWEIFGPLLAGIRSAIVPDELLLEPYKFVEQLGRHGVTRIVLVPSLLRVLLDTVPDLATRLPRLTLWSLSGEVLPVDLARRFHNMLPDAILLNIYGSSEVTADVTCCEVSRLPTLTSVPIGKPIDNTQIYILDRHKNLVPPLVQGEIHVGGDCLARGYWRQAELTAERFIPNPYQSDLSPSLFATGDLGRFLSDGNIEYLGRLDTQIKLRGMRIEPGEVEASLIAHPQVRDAVIAVHGDSSENQYLVAYFVRSTLFGPSTDEIRSFLKSRLPQYMIPAMFVEMDRLPMLPSGKIDRMALPSPALGGPSKRRIFASARNEIETRLSAIWREVLGLDQVSVDDNFFDLGGHSLDATRVLARVRRDLHLEVPIRVLFDRPTIGEFALEVERRKAAGDTIALTTQPATAPPSSALLNLLRAELSALSADQFDAFMKSVEADRKARMSERN